MKSRLALILLILLPSFALANVNEEFEKTRKQFVGHWKIEAGERLTKVEWREDGTFSSKTTEGDKIIWMLQGVWWIGEGSFHGVCLKSSELSILLGKDQPSEIIKVSQTGYAIKSSKGKIHSYKRFKKDDEQGITPDR